MDTYPQRSKARNRIEGILRALEREEDRLSVFRQVGEMLGVKVANPRSGSAERKKRSRERKRDGHTQYAVVGSPPPASLSPGPPIPSTPTSTSKKRVAASQKPKKTDPPPTETEVQIIRALNAERLKIIPGDLGYPADSEHTKALRKRLKAGYSVADILTLIAWWPTRKRDRYFNPLECFTPQTLFGDTFVKNIGNAKGWKVGRTDIVYDQPRPGDVDPDEFQRRLGGT